MGTVSVEHVQSRPGAYADSVTLMQVTASARAVGGVRAAMVAMATDLNLALLAELGLAAPPGLRQQDLLVAIKADDPASLSAALEVVEGTLADRPPTGGDEDAGPTLRPRTTSSAIARSGPGVALVSVPGRYAFAEAVDALSRGCDVMIFSDNVPVEQEIALKEMAAERGVLVMGPDCGTAIVGGIGLGFANSVRPGPVGVVAASGTGAQQLICLLDAAGVGCGAVLGVGGRDLSAEVGGRSARMALAVLEEDPATKLIVLVSKRPAPAVVAALNSYSRTLTTPVQFAFIAPGHDLTSAAERAVRTMGRPVPEWPHWPATGRSRRIAGNLRGLFAGGTLCDEAVMIAAGRLGPIYSNVATDPALRIEPRSSLDQHSHVMIDFGADELTGGRPHPMIDQRLRLDHLSAAAADETTAVIMLDVVLGYGAHPDPAAEIAPVIAVGKTKRDVEVVVSLIGTQADPQGLGAQAAALAGAGAHVFASNARAARFACDLLGRTHD